MKQVIIIGGGYSISEGIKQQLWHRLKDRFTIGLNYSYRYFEPTALCYVDNAFCRDNEQALKQLPLVITKKSAGGEENGFVTLPPAMIYDRSLKKGVYNPQLCGMFALSLAIYLIGEGEIYLLGYDFGKVSGKTHFYQDKLTHRGVGKTDYYSSEKSLGKFDCYKHLTGISIFNVSPESGLNQFTKIDYGTFFNLLINEKLDQVALRKEIIDKIRAI